MKAKPEPKLTATPYILACICTSLGPNCSTFDLSLNRIYHCMLTEFKFF